MLALRMLVLLLLMLLLMPARVRFLYLSPRPVLNTQPRKANGA